MNEITLNEKTQTKLAEQIRVFLDAQEKIKSIVQTILDVNNVEGKWDFPIEDGKIDITRLVKLEEQESTGESDE